MLDLTDDKMLAAFGKYMAEQYPDVYETFVEYNAPKPLNTGDEAQWDMLFTDEQREVLEAIYKRCRLDEDNCKFTTRANWRECPVIGLELDHYFEVVDAMRRERIFLVDALTDIFPLDDGDCEYFEETAPEKAAQLKKLTVGQVNQILEFLRDKAHTSVTFDW